MLFRSNRGYILNAPHTITRVFKVSHTDAQTEDELYSIVDLGGTVVNVMVNHRVYGHMEAPLGISSRLKVKAFIDDIKNGKSSPLKNITSNYHYHTVEADSEKTARRSSSATFPPVPLQSVSAWKRASYSTSRPSSSPTKTMSLATRS